MVNNFVGFFIIFLPRVVLFRVATGHSAYSLRGRRPKGREKGKDEHTQATLHIVIVATEYVLECLECCYHDHQVQKRLMVVGVMNK